MTTKRALRPGCETMEGRLVMSAIPGHPMASGAAAIDLARARPSHAAASFTATPVSSTQVDLAWGKVSGASKYVIEESVGGRWTTLATVSKKTMGYTIGGLPAGSTDTFDVVYRKGGRKHAETPHAVTTPSSGETFSETAGANDPLTNGFNDSYDVGSGSTMPVTGDQGYAAWEITAPDTSDQIVYMDQSALTTAQSAAIASQGFTETLVARVTTNGSNASTYDQSQTVIGFSSAAVLGSNAPRFDIDLGLDSNGNTVVVLPTSVTFGAGSNIVATGMTYTVAGSGYHTYQLYYNPGTSSADLYVDGQLALTGYTGQTDYLGSWQLYWGVVSGGQGYFAQVELQSGNDIV